MPTEAADLPFPPSEELFRTLADNISQLAWMADPNGWIFWFNRRWYEFTGTTLDEMQGWGWTSVHHPEHVDRVVERMTHSWGTGEPWEDTFPLRGHDGQFRSFLSRALPVRDEDGSVVCWFGTNTDVTEQLEAEQERERLLANEQSARHRAEGIPTSDLPHVFERYRGASNVSTKFAGTGLGLAGARDLIELHGGSISVTSVEGVGSNFVVRLPLKRRKAYV